MSTQERSFALMAIKDAAEAYSLEGRHDLGIIASSLLTAVSVALDEDENNDLVRMCQQALLLITGSAEIGNEESVSNEVARLCKRLLG